MTSALTTAPRPAWRGLVHRYAALLFVPAFVVLVVLADSPHQRLNMSVYALSILLMLSVSAVYHSGRLGPRAHGVLRRVDHSTILLAVAGSYTGICSLALQGTPEIIVLTAVWGAGLVGVVIRMCWLHAPSWLVAAVYLVVGWCALIQIAPLMRSLHAADTTLLMVGGGLYSAGAAVYATKRPNPFPHHFGFHEVFHTLVVAAAVVHFVLVLRLLLR